MAAPPAPQPHKHVVIHDFVDSGDHVIRTQKTKNMLQQHHAHHKDDVMKTKLDRPLFHQKSFNEAYQLDRPVPQSALSRTSDFVHKKCACDRKSLWRMAKRRVPVLDWIPKYNVRENAVPDLLGGITVGIMQIPQGMAYALLAGMPPVMGLYVSFFSVLVYFLLGTSRHLSLGTFAVICLMTGAVVDTYVSTHPLPGHALNHTAGNDTGSQDDEQALVDLKVQVATATAFTVGCIQIGLAVVQLGSLSVYLSETLVSGFTTGAAVLVFTSQVKYVLGLDIPNYSGVLGVVYTYVDIFQHIQQTNLVTLGLSACVIVCLVLVNDCLNLRFKSRMIMPIPTELLVIVVTTLASYYLHLHEAFGVVVVGDIPTGIPPPTLPHFRVMDDVLVSSIAIAIVSFCLPISMAKIYAKKHRYDVDPNQEMLAYGCGNFLGGFFMCFPACGSLSRSSVQEGSGAKTQVASLVSCVLVVIVLLFIAPLFEPVPNCVLSGIIMVALRGMFRQYKDLLSAWKFSKSEAAVWLVTFLSVVFLDVNYGLVVSVTFILVVLLYKLQRPYTTLLGNVPTTDTYLDLQKYKVPKEVKGLKIVHFGGPLYFANREYFRRTIYKLVFNPQEEVARRKRAEKRSRDDTHSTISSQDLVERAGTKKSQEDLTLYPEEEGVWEGEVFEERHPLPPPACPDTTAALILDCAAVSFVDSAAISMLSQLLSVFDDVGVKLCLANCKDGVLMKLEKSALYPQLEPNVFPSTHDAVLHLVRVRHLPTISAAVSTTTVSTTIDEEESEPHAPPPPSTSNHL